AASRVVGDRVVDAELTAAVPVSGGVDAVVGGSLLFLSAASSEQRVLATVAGRPYVLHANDRQGVDMLVAEAVGDVAIMRVDGAGVRTIGRGPSRTLQLYAGRGGANLVLGASRVDISGTNLRTAQSPAGAGVSAASLDGAVLLTDAGGQASQTQRTK